MYITVIKPCITKIKSINQINQRKFNKICWTKPTGDLQEILFLSLNSQHKDSQADRFEGLNPGRGHHLSIMTRSCRPY